MIFNVFSKRLASSCLLMFISTVPAFAQSDPWTSSAVNLQTAFTGPIATALIAVAVVIAGLTFAFSEGAGKRQLAGIAFGGAMAMGATRFMLWLFT
ncbi:MAG TPA: TrbC/VirB2 family protein [Bryobacteraceae bacterium]|nr:TrbC/VirB2 family protein [Bryobacteraceae bacterium]